MRIIVVPGDMLSDKPMRIENAIIEDNKTYSTVMGVFDDASNVLTPLEGLWYPKHGDNIIGIVEEEKSSTYLVDLNAPYKGLIITRFEEIDLSVGYIIEATIKELDKTKTVVLMRPRKLEGGKILYIKPSKVPRIIGKSNTMLMQLGNGTKSNIRTGMNGIIWLKGGDVELAIKAIMRIQNEAHVSGLTDRIKEMLEQEGSKQNTTQ